MRANHQKLKMGKINRCIKGLFISFNALFAILGCVLIYGDKKFSAISHQMSKVGCLNLVWNWVFAIGILGISCLGIYAGFFEKEIIILKVGSPNLAFIWMFTICILSISCMGIYASFFEKEILLKIFAGFMGVGMIIMLIFGIIVVVGRNKVKLSFDSASAEAAKPFMEDEKLREKLDGLQQDLQCCGVLNASDWGDNIPNSCNCSGFGYGGYGGPGCKSKPQGVSGPDQIYAQPCSEIIFLRLDRVFKIAMGLCFGFAVTALLGLLVSLLMIIRITTGRSFIAMRGY